MKDWQLDDVYRPSMQARNRIRRSSKAGKQETKEEMATDCQTHSSNGGITTGKQSGGRKDLFTQVQLFRKSFRRQQQGNYGYELSITFLTSWKIVRIRPAPTAVVKSKSQQCDINNMYRGGCDSVVVFLVNFIITCHVSKCANISENWWSNPVEIGKPSSHSKVRICPSWNMTNSWERFDLYKHCRCSLMHCHREDNEISPALGPSLILRVSLAICHFVNQLSWYDIPYLHNLPVIRDEYYLVTWK